MISHGYYFENWCRRTNKYVKKNDLYFLIAPCIYRLMGNLNTSNPLGIKVWDLFLSWKWLENPGSYIIWEVTNTWKVFGDIFYSFLCSLKKSSGNIQNKCVRKMKGHDSNVIFVITFCLLNRGTLTYNRFFASWEHR